MIQRDSPNVRLHVARIRWRRNLSLTLTILSRTCFLRRHRCGQDLSFPLHRSRSSGQCTLCTLFFFIRAFDFLAGSAFFQRQWRSRWWTDFWLWPADHWWPGYRAYQQLCIFTAFPVYQWADHAQEIYDYFHKPEAGRFLSNLFWEKPFPASPATIRWLNLSGKRYPHSENFFRRKVKNGTRRIDYTSVGRLGMIPLESCRSLGQKVDEWLVNGVRSVSIQNGFFRFEGYKEIPIQSKFQNPRFGSGEGKCDHRVRTRRWCLYSDGRCM